VLSTIDHIGVAVEDSEESEIDARMGCRGRREQRGGVMHGGVGPVEAERVEPTGAGPEATAPVPAGLVASELAAAATAPAPTPPSVRSHSYLVAEK